VNSVLQAREEDRVTTLDVFVDLIDSAYRQHPLRALREFLDQEEANYRAKRYADLRFVGYVLDIGYETATIVTSDAFKKAVGGVPRNALLIMVQADRLGLASHFTLLRVLESAPTPLAQEVQQTYFELQKKSMPELDLFTQAELQWSALKAAVLGMFYPHPSEWKAVEFSGDLHNFVAAHKYRVYAPTDDLLDLIVNGRLPVEGRFEIGQLRLSECRLTLPGKRLPKVPVFVSTADLKGKRTALFGKTRFGKSTIVKLIAESLILTTEQTRDVGQLIFDADGEYANDNPQDGNLSLASAYPARCVVYAITPKQQTPSRPLRIDFYREPQAGLRILHALLQQDNRASSNYIANFVSVDLPRIDEIPKLPWDERRRATRKVLMYWAILYRAGFDPGQRPIPLRIDPEFNARARQQMYAPNPPPPPPTTLAALLAELEAAARADRSHPPLQSSSGGPLFDADDKHLLGMLSPASATSTGPAILAPYRKYHDATAGNFVGDILKLLDQGQTVILDLGNAPPEVMAYFSDYLTRWVFAYQVLKFSNNALGKHYVQLYFEEAHNLFPADEKPGEASIYRRIAKEGAKYHLGMVYSTQSPSTINKDLLAQTENFFVAHMSSQDEVKALARMNVYFEGLQQDILATRTPGYVRMLTPSHRFVVPVQARKFAPGATLSGPDEGGLSPLDFEALERGTDPDEWEGGGEGPVHADDLEMTRDPDEWHFGDPRS
jgi:hypothetical protein